jgi:hypothetical protein
MFKYKKYLKNIRMYNFIHLKYICMYFCINLLFIYFTL